MNLLNSLHDNTGWEILNSSSHNLVSTKQIPERDLFAVMVKKDIDLPKNILQDVIMDVNNYKQFLKSSDSFISNEINRTTHFVDGYQFIPINIPFFDNREYLFRMYPSGFKNDDSISIIHWYLLDENEIVFDKKNHSATYLSHGAGLWVAEEKSNNKTSYFSFYDVTQKTSIVIGMTLFATVDQITGSMRNSILLFFIFFVAGALVLIKLNKKKNVV